MKKYESLESIALEKELKPLYESALPQDMYVRARIGGGGGGSGPYSQSDSIGGGGGGSAP